MGQVEGLSCARVARIPGNVLILLSKDLGPAGPEDQSAEVVSSPVRSLSGSPVLEWARTDGLRAIWLRARSLERKSLIRAKTVWSAILLAVLPINWLPQRLFEPCSAVA